MRGIKETEAEGTQQACIIVGNSDETKEYNVFFVKDCVVHTTQHIQKARKKNSVKNQVPHLCGN